MTFSELQQRIYELNQVPNVDFFVVGYSMLGVPIYGAHVGSYDGNQLLVEGAIHAREYVTALLIVEQVKYYATQNINGGMYFIPLSNPDGVRLVLDGLDGVNCPQLRYYLDYLNGGSGDYSQWKANANAVDLNVNFDADWGGGSQNVFCPAPANFVGYYPNSEREVNALREFTLKNQPNITISYHTRGEVIYYGFTGLTPAQLSRDFDIAQNISEVTGYEIIRTSNSTGGYSDWVSRTLGVPAYTIEVGSVEWSHPIGAEYLPEIYEKNREVPRVALDSVNALSVQSRRKRPFEFLFRNSRK